MYYLIFKCLLSCSQQLKCIILVMRDCLTLPLTTRRHVVSNALIERLNPGKFRFAFQV